jgi:hypothetical protein
VRHSRPSEFFADLAQGIDRNVELAVRPLVATPLVFDAACLIYNGSRGCVSQTNKQLDKAVALATLVGAQVNKTWLKAR